MSNRQRRMRRFLRLPKHRVPKTRPKTPPPRDARPESGAAMLDLAPFAFVLAFRHVAFVLERELVVGRVRVHGAASLGPGSRLWSRLARGGGGGDRVGRGERPFPRLLRLLEGFLCLLERALRPRGRRRRRQRRRGSLRRGHGHARQRSAEAGHRQHHRRLAANMADDPCREGPRPTVRRDRLLHRIHDRVVGAVALGQAAGSAWAQQRQRDRRGGQAGGVRTVWTMSTMTSSMPVDAAKKFKTECVMPYSVLR